MYDKLKKIALVTAVRQPSRFGILQIQNNVVTNFEEKPFNNKNERRYIYLDFLYDIGFLDNSVKFLEVKRSTIF